MKSISEQIPAAETERMMKIQDVILKAMAGILKWWEAAEIIGVTDRTMRISYCPPCAMPMQPTLFRKALSDQSHPQPRVINTDLAPIYGSAIADIKKEATLRSRCR